MHDLLLAAYQAVDGDGPLGKRGQPRGASASPAASRKAAKSTTNRGTKRPGAPGNNGDDGDNGGGKKQCRGKAKDNGDPTWACPFYKYAPHAHRRCRPLIFSRIPDVRQHIMRSHRQQMFCPSCGDIFPAMPQLHSHVRQRQCEQRNFPPPPGADPDQLEEMRVGGEVQDMEGSSMEVRRWYRIWDIMFPPETGVPRPLSPYYDGTEYAERRGETVRAFRASNSTLEFLRQRDLPPGNGFEDLLDAYLDFVEDFARRADRDSPPSLSTRDSSSSTQPTSTNASSQNLNASSSQLPGPSSQNLPPSATQSFSDAQQNAQVSSQSSEHLYQPTTSPFQAQRADAGQPSMPAASTSTAPIAPSGPSAPSSIPRPQQHANAPAAPHNPYQATRPPLEESVTLSLPGQNNHAAQHNGQFRDVASMYDVTTTGVLVTGPTTHQHQQFNSNPDSDRGEARLDTTIDFIGAFPSEDEDDGLWTDLLNDPENGSS